MSDILTLPVLPLREAVVFPGVLTPIQAGRRRTLNAVQAASDTEEKLVFTVAQRRNSDSASPEDLYTIGTIARLAKLQAGPGSIQLLLEGSGRGIAVRYSQNEDYLEAIVKPAEDMTPVDAADPAFVALHRELRERAAEFGERAGFTQAVISQVLGNLKEPGPLTDLIASNLEIQTAERQSLLETLSVEERMRRVLVHVQRQIGVLEAQEDIQSKVQAELGDRQREIVLREQLKQIQKELGDVDESEDVDELVHKLRSLPLPEDARKEIDRELGRLGRMSRESMEYQVVRTYLETVAELPWTERSDDHLDLAAAAEILEEDHYGLNDVKDRVLEFLAVRQLQDAREATEVSEGDQVESDGDTEGAEDGAATAPGNEDDKSTKGPILLFAGPPGVGKTSIAKSIARAMGRKYVRVSLGGARDEADIRGHRRTYVGAMPGRILQGMKQAGTRNPVFLLDEVDKLGVSYQGDPASALLEVLDPAQNDTFVDHYLGVPFDLSEVLFVATANFLQSIPGPLRDRMEMVEFTGYTENEKLEIGKRYLAPRQITANALDDDQIEITDEAMLATITKYTREAGVRQLERELGRLARKVARRIAGGEVERVVLEQDDVRELLGRSRIHPERASGQDQVGVATGMYYTPAGGDIMFVEVTTMPGKGELVLTGQLGDVMKESARAAWSYARTHASDLLIHDPGSDRDVHVHVPAGAIPKDGPSAGVTMATALVSALSNRPSRHDLAMTGEITLSGRVLPIGGVKEKVLGAVRAGIGAVILPKENEADLEDLPEEVRETLDFHFLDDLGDVLRLAIRDAKPGASVYADGEGRESDRPLTSDLEH